MPEEPIKILTDREVEAAFQGLIREAGEFFTLVSPNISFKGSWLALITNAVQRGIEVCVVYNPWPEEESSQNHLANLPEGVKKCPVEYLHAKIYMTDKSVIIASMNYTNWSNMNREIAVRFERHTAQQAYNEVSAYVDELLHRMPERNEGESVLLIERTQGHCIYCGEASIFYNPKKPLCREHWRPWLYNRPNYKQKYCHNCGEERETTLADPLCAECA